jgi:hypothetical protein
MGNLPSARAAFHATHAMTTKPAGAKDQLVAADERLQVPVELVQLRDSLCSVTNNFTTRSTIEQSFTRWHIKQTLKETISISDPENANTVLEYVSIIGVITSLNSVSRLRTDLCRWKTSSDRRHRTQYRATQYVMDACVCACSGASAHARGHQQFFICRSDSVASFIHIVHIGVSFFRAAISPIK